MTGRRAPQHDPAGLRARSGGRERPPGAVGTALSPEIATVLGGAMCLAGCAVVPLAVPQLWSFDITAEHALGGGE